MAKRAESVKVTRATNVIWWHFEMRGGERERLRVKSRRCRRHEGGSAFDNFKMGGQRTNCVVEVYVELLGGFHV